MKKRLLKMLSVSAVLCAAVCCCPACASLDRMERIGGKEMFSLEVSDDTVNLWPLCVVTPRYTSILWPFIDIDRDGMAIRPLYCREGSEVSFIFPAVCIDASSGNGWVFNAYWSKYYYFGMFPLFHYSTGMSKFRFRYALLFWTMNGSYGIFPFFMHSPDSNMMYMFPLFYAKVKDGATSFYSPVFAFEKGTINMDKNLSEGTLYHEGQPYSVYGRKLYDSWYWSLLYYGKGGKSIRLKDDISFSEWKKSVENVNDGNLEKAVDEKCRKIDSFYWNFFPFAKYESGDGVSDLDVLASAFRIKRSAGHNITSVLGPLGYYSDRGYDHYEMCETSDVFSIPYISMAKRWKPYARQWGNNDGISSRPSIKTAEEMYAYFLFYGGGEEHLVLNENNESLQNARESDIRKSLKNQWSDNRKGQLYRETHSVSEQFKNIDEYNAAIEKERLANSKIVRSGYAGLLPFVHHSWTDDSSAYNILGGLAASWKNNPGSSSANAFCGAIFDYERNENKAHFFSLPSSWWTENFKPDRFSSEDVGEYRLYRSALKSTGSWYALLAYGGNSTYAVMKKDVSCPALAKEIKESLKNIPSGKPETEFEKTEHERKKISVYRESVVKNSMDEKYSYSGVAPFFHYNSFRDDYSLHIFGGLMATFSKWDDPGSEQYYSLNHVFGPLGAMSFKNAGKHFSKERFFSIPYSRIRDKAEPSDFSIYMSDLYSPGTRAAQRENTSTLYFLFYKSHKVYAMLNPDMTYEKYSGLVEDEIKKKVPKHDSAKTDPVYDSYISEGDDEKAEAVRRDTLNSNSHDTAIDSFGVFPFFDHTTNGTDFNSFSTFCGLGSMYSRSPEYSETSLFGPFGFRIAKQTYPREDSHRKYEADTNILLLFHASEELHKPVFCKRKTLMCGKDAGSYPGIRSDTYELLLGITESIRWDMKMKNSYNDDYFSTRIDGNVKLFKRIVSGRNLSLKAPSTPAEAEELIKTLSTAVYGEKYNDKSLCDSSAKNMLLPLYFCKSKTRAQDGASSCDTVIFPLLSWFSRKPDGSSSTAILAHLLYSQEYTAQSPYSPLTVAEKRDINGAPRSWNPLAGHLFSSEKQRLLTLFARKTYSVVEWKPDAPQTEIDFFNAACSFLSDLSIYEKSDTKRNKDDFLKAKTSLEKAAAASGRRVVFDEKDFASLRASAIETAEKYSIKNEYVAGGSPLGFLFDYITDGKDCKHFSLLGGMLAEHHKTDKTSDTSVLGLVYRNTTEGTKSSSMIFPFITTNSDTAKDQSKFSFMWRVLNIEKKDGHTSGHILFIPF